MARSGGGLSAGAWWTRARRHQQWTLAAAQTAATPAMGSGGGSGLGSSAGSRLGSHRRAAGLRAWIT